MIPRPSPEWDQGLSQGLELAEIVFWWTEQFPIINHNEQQNLIH